MRYFLIFLFAFLTACGSTVPVVKPFKMDIQQGNVVTSKMLLQLRPGMTKSQVRFIMGTPLIIDSFHSNRWDYFYQLRQAGKIVEQRRVILDFDKDLLSKVRGDVVPEGTAGAASDANVASSKVIEKPAQKPKEKSMLDKLKFWKKDEPAAEVAKPAPVPSAAPEANKEAAPSDAPQVNTDAPVGDTPSILAVPIGGASALDVPSADAPSAEMPMISAPSADAPLVEALPIEAPKVEAPAVETMPVVEVLPVQAPPVEAPKVEMPAPVVPSAKEDENLIFRMDRNLDLKNLEATPAEAAPTAVDAKAKPKKVEPPPLPEAEPGYFERMLEKIGF